MTDEAIGDLVRARLFANEQLLQKTFADWDEWPADAQLGVLSMAWAMGPGFPAMFPRFTAACQAQDWRTAASQCRINETGNAGVKPRNEANIRLFNNAAVVADSVLDPSQVYYPADAADAATPENLVLEQP